MSPRATAHATPALTDIGRVRTAQRGLRARRSRRCSRSPTASAGTRRARSRARIAVETLLRPRAPRDADAKALGARGARREPRGHRRRARGPRPRGHGHHAHRRDGRGHAHRARARRRLAARTCCTSGALERLTAGPLDGRRHDPRGHSSPRRRRASTPTAASSRARSASTRTWTPTPSRSTPRPATGCCCAPTACTSMLDGRRDRRDPRRRTPTRRWRRGRSSTRRTTRAATTTSPSSSSTSGRAAGARDRRRVRRRGRPRAAVRLAARCGSSGVRSRSSAARRYGGVLATRAPARTSIAEDGVVVVYRGVPGAFAGVPLQLAAGRDRPSPVDRARPRRPSRASREGIRRGEPRATPCETLADATAAQRRLGATGAVRRRTPTRMRSMRRDARPSCSCCWPPRPPVLLVFALVDAQRTHATFDLARPRSCPAALLAAFVVAHLAVRRFAPGRRPGAAADRVRALGRRPRVRHAARRRARRAARCCGCSSAWRRSSPRSCAVPSLERARALQVHDHARAASCCCSLPARHRPRDQRRQAVAARSAGCSFQPAEVAKILIVLFLAAYLAENREMLSVSTRRVLGMWLPRAAHARPAAADVGASRCSCSSPRRTSAARLLFFGDLPRDALRRHRPARLRGRSGSLLFARRRDGRVLRCSATCRRASPSGSTRSPTPPGSGYQLVQSLFALGGGRHDRRRRRARACPTRIPFVETDFIFSAIGEELGLLGGGGGHALPTSCSACAASPRRRAPRRDMAAFTAAGLVAAHRAAGVRHRRRRHPAHPAHRRHAPLRELRRLVAARRTSCCSRCSCAPATRAPDARPRCRRPRPTWACSAGSRSARRLTRVAIVLALLLGGARREPHVDPGRRSAARAARTTRPTPATSPSEARSDRGSILTRDGVVLAESVPDGRSVFERALPAGRARRAHVSATSAPRYGRAGIEAAANDALAGQARLLRLARRRSTRRPACRCAGNDVVLTIDTRVQRPPRRRSRDAAGACVVLDPRTGAVLALAADPGYDPGERRRRLGGALRRRSGAPLVDRAHARRSTRPARRSRSSRSPARSAHGIATPATHVPGPGTLEIGGAPVTNFEGGSYGELDLSKAHACARSTPSSRSSRSSWAPRRSSAQADALRLRRRSRRYELPAPRPRSCPTPTR